MPVTGSPTQQGMDGSQVNRRRGNHCSWPRTARLNSKLVSRESETTIPFFNVEGTHVARGCDDRPVILPTVVPNEDYMITSINSRSRSRRLKKHSSHDLRYQMVSWNDDVPLRKVKVSKKTKAEPVVKAHTGEDNTQLDMLGGACESVSCRGWTVVRASMQPYGKHYTAKCLLSNGKYEKKVTIEDVRDEENLLNLLHYIHNATV